MSELENKLTQILQEKNTKLISSNIKKDVTIFGVTGTLEEGLDTSDANATAEDIASGKTAYVGDNKITGTLTEYDANISAETMNSTPETLINLDTPIEGNQKCLYLEKIVSEPKILRIGSRVDAMIWFTDIAQVLGITADKIKSGETILGVTGTYTGESTEVSE